MTTRQPSTTGLDYLEPTAAPPAPGPPAAGPPAAAVDVTVLDALITELGEVGEGMRPLLWHSYLEEAGPLVARLTAAAGAGDGETVRSAAHQLKSSSALLGAVPLSRLLQQAEDAARAGSQLPPVAAAAAAAAEYLRVTAAVKVLCGETL